MNQPSKRILTEQYLYDHPDEFVKTNPDGTGYTTDAGGGGGGVSSVNSGSGITVDNTDPTAPIPNLGGSATGNITIDLGTFIFLLNGLNLTCNFNADTGAITLNGNGDISLNGAHILLNGGVPSYADNAAALSGGVPSDGLYYTEVDGERFIKIAHD